MAGIRMQGSGGLTGVVTNTAAFAVALGALPFKTIWTAVQHLRKATSSS